MVTPEISAQDYLNKRVRDSRTGFIGLVTCVTTHMNGCVSVECLGQHDRSRPDKAPLSMTVPSQSADILPDPVSSKQMMEEMNKTPPGGLSTRSARP